MTSAAAAPTSPADPFQETWTGAFGVPPFGAIAHAHFRPAFARALAEHDAEIAAIAGRAEAPDFANTIEALERSGQALARVGKVFWALAGAHTDKEIQAIEREMAPKLAAHHSRIHLNAALFRRIAAVFARRDSLGLTPEQERVLERYHTEFLRSGAGLGEGQKQRLAAITERLASLGTAFSQNVLADEQDYALVLNGEADLAGLPDFVRAAASRAASDRGLAGRHVVTLGRSSVEPFLQFSARRDLREQAFRAWIARGDGGARTDNKAIIAEMVALRAERARLHGYASFAHFRLDDSMAKTPEAVRGLLQTVWPRALRRALADRDAMQALIAEEGGNFRLAPWDWRYYAEKLRKRAFDVDEAATKPYLQLDNVIAAAFDTATRLFGVTFEEQRGIPAWHPDVRIWEVRGRDGRHVGLFFGDYFARPSKHSGAWMTNVRGQEKLRGDIRPLVINVMNFSKGADGEPALLSFDDARTLFHEFGHALHGLLSDVTYPRVSGTGVLRDFVELPSQLYEHWLERPEVLRRFALHYKTGAPMPDDLLRRLLAARTFNQGAMTVEYVSSALLDLEFHLLADADGLDVNAFERETLTRLGMPEELVMRHRPPHFQHVFSGDAYSSAYYSYMWSEVLDSDAFQAFEEAGDIFDPATAKKLHDHIYSAGGSRDPETLYTALRGRLPTADALLVRRGLADAAFGGEA